MSDCECDFKCLHAIVPSRHGECHGRCYGKEHTEITAIVSSLLLLLAVVLLLIGGGEC